jgi:hypothetical protein
MRAVIGTLLTIRNRLFQTMNNFYPDPPAREQAMEIQSQWRDSNSQAKRVPYLEANSMSAARGSLNPEANSTSKRGYSDHIYPSAPLDYPVDSSPQVFVTTQGEVPFIMDNLNYANVSKLWKYIQHNNVRKYQQQARESYFSRTAYHAAVCRFEAAGEFDFRKYSDEEFFSKLLRFLTTGHSLKSVSLKDMLIAQKYSMSPNTSNGLEVYFAFHKVLQPGSRSDQYCQG